MKLAIYGAGGLGREVRQLACAINAHQHRWDRLFFIDDIHPQRMLDGTPVTDLASAQGVDAVEVVIAVGEPALRARLSAKIRAAGLSFATLVHPDVMLPDSTSLGEGVVICRHAFISCDCVIEHNVYLQPHCCLGHDCQIGEHAIISPGVMLGGECCIGRRVFIGMNASVKEKVRIGHNVIISMGAALFNDVQDGLIALGNPARIIRRNEDEKVFRPAGLRRSR